MLNLPRLMSMQRCSSLRFGKRVQRMNRVSSGTATSIFSLAVRPSLASVDYAHIITRWQILACRRVGSLPRVRALQRKTTLPIDGDGGEPGETHAGPTGADATRRRDDVFP